MSGEVARVHALARVAVAFVWIYHGLVPKVLGPHEDELRLAALHGLPEDHLSSLLRAAGALEIVFGIAILVLRRSRWPFVVSAAALVALLIDVAAVAPEYLWATFNPVSLNAAVIALSVIGFLTAGRATGTSA